MRRINRKKQKDEEVISKAHDTLTKELDEVLARTITLEMVDVDMIPEAVPEAVNALYDRWIAFCAKMRKKDVSLVPKQRIFLEKMIEHIQKLCNTNWAINAATIADEKYGLEISGIDVFKEHRAKFRDPEEAVIHIVVNINPS